MRCVSFTVPQGPVVVGIEATGAMQWFLELLEEQGIECRVGHPAKMRAAETRKPKHDRRDARLVLDLLTQDRFPEIWMPSAEQRDLRTLLRDRCTLTAVKDAMSCSVCTLNYKSGSKSWTKKWRARLDKDHRPAGG